MALASTLLLAILFDTPLAAAAVAGAAVAVPIVIHLLNRRRFQVVTWAAMRFLLTAQRKNSRRMRIEQLLLLAVRCLLLLLLTLALASVTPWAEAAWRWLAPEAVASRMVGTQRMHRILVIDGSLSMAARDAEGSAFDRARAMASRIVRESSAGDGFSVILMTSPPRRIVPEPSEDARKVVAEIDSLRLPHGEANLPATLAMVDAMLQASPGKFADREVYFLTDLQRATWILSQPGTVAGVLQGVQARGRTVLVDVGRDRVDNLAVTSLALADDLATTQRPATIVATVQCFGESPQQPVPVRFLVGRARGAAGELPAEPRVVQEALVRIESGQQTPVAFTFKFPTPGDYLLQVRIPSDSLEPDDSRSAVVTVKKDIPVLLVNGKPFGEPFDQATEWLRLALNPFDRGPSAGPVSAQPRVIGPSQFADEGQGDLRNSDVVFLCDLPSISLAESRRLESFVRRGGGVVVFLGEQVEPGEYNRILYRGGDGLLPAPLLGKFTAPPNYSFQFQLEEGSETQPPLKAFRATNDRNALLNVRFRRFFQLGEPAGRVKPRRLLTFAPVAIPGREPNATDSKAPPPGAPALLDWQPPLPREDRPARSDEPELAPTARTAPALARGRVMLLNTSANSDWSNWPASPSFPAFVQELLLHAAGGRLREQASSVGEPLEVFLREAGTGEATLTGPEGRSETFRLEAGVDAGIVRWNDTDQSGVYRLTVAGQPREYLLAVNVPVATESQQGGESDLTRTDSDELARTYPEWELQVVTDPRRIVRTASATAAGPEIVTVPLGTAVARALLLAVLGLVLVEVVLAWRFGHHAEGAAFADDTNRVRPTRFRWLTALVPATLLASVGLLAAVLLHDAATGDFLGFLSESARRNVEHILQIPPPTAGESSRWRLEYTYYLWSPSADPWLAGALALVGVTLIYLVHRREARRLSRGRRFALTTLRCALLLLLLGVLLPQVRLWFERQGWPDIVLLIDDSHSMSAIDRYRDPSHQAAADRLAQLAERSEAERLTIVQSLLSRTQPDWLGELLNRRKVRVHVYHCSTQARRLCDLNAPSDVPAAVQAIRNLKAEPAHDASRLGAAVRQVLNDFRGASLSALVMLTDGVTTEGEELSKAARYAAQQNVPLFFVGLGDAHDARDLRLHDLQVEDTVYVNDRVVFELRLTGQGYEHLSVPVTLREKGSDRVLDSQAQVKVDPSGRPVRLRLIHQPSEPGEKIYEIEVPPQPDEIDRENNKLERAVFVRESKLIKVLYVEGYRRYEYHYLKTLLERESDRSRGNKTIDLKFLLLDADSDFPAQDRSALADFPTRAELNTYDVVILGDVDPRSAEQPRLNEFLKDLADFVRERGGGLLALSGERHLPTAYADSPLRDVLPVEIIVERAPEDPDRHLPSGYQPELTPVGRLHPIFRFTPDEKENEQIWSALRPLYWWSDGYRPKRAAEVLAVHPGQRSRREGRPAAPDVAQAPDRHPLVVQQFVGAGRSLFLGFNETWRWGHREDQLRYNQFWIQTIRYLARSRLGRIEMRLDRQSPYRRGEPIRLTVRFPDDAPPPAPDTEVKVVAERRGAGREGDTEIRTLQLARLEGSRATYETTLTRTPEGNYRFWLSQPVVPEPKPRVECRVLSPPGEMDRLRMNQPELERAAEESRGRFYNLAEVDRLLDDLPPGTRITLSAPAPPWALWSHWGLFLLAFGLICSEWLLRKSANLL